MKNKGLHGIFVEFLRDIALAKSCDGLWQGNRTYNVLSLILIGCS